MSEVIKELQGRIKDLRAQLAEAQKDRDNYKIIADCNAKNFNVMQKDRDAALERVKRLKTAIKNTALDRLYQQHRADIDQKENLQLSRRCKRMEEALEFIVGTATRSSKNAGLALAVRLDRIDTKARAELEGKG